MRTLPETELAPLEEHLLSCFRCRERLQETERYVEAMRTAAGRIRGAPRENRDAVIDVAAKQLREHGVAALQAVFPKDVLTRLHEAADRCFDAIEARESCPERYHFNRFSHSILLAALLDFGCTRPEELVDPLSVAGLDELFAEAIGSKWICNLEQSWVRKKFAPGHAPGHPYHPQTWHQDGALGVRFPLDPAQAMPMTQLLTCWIPLNPCGRDSPGLEFIRSRQAGLLHYTELDDSALRRRFPPEEFWTPVLEFGDGLVFLNSTLHRTYAHAGMRQNRLSVEYRLFPG